VTKRLNGSGHVGLVRINGFYNTPFSGLERQEERKRLPSGVWESTGYEPLELDAPRARNLLSLTRLSHACRPGFENGRFGFEF